MMKRITFLLIVVLGGLAFTSGHPHYDEAPIFVTEIPPGYRDWRLISVAQEGGSQRHSRHSGQRRCDQSLPRWQASVSGRRDHCPRLMEIRFVGRK